MKRYQNCVFITLLIFFFSCTRDHTPSIETDVLIIGGGASGISAAIQSSRSGAKTLLMEETPWLGGMLTAAGVSATDGNHRLPSGLWGEFRQGLYDVYGGPEAVFTGWVSNTQFEPSVGDSIWKAKAAQEDNLQIRYGYRPIEVHKEDNVITGATLIGNNGQRIRINARITVDATELGDVLAMAEIPFFTGSDIESQPQNDHIQDLTYAAILKDYGPDADMTIPQPDDYEPEDFECICKKVCPEPDSTQYDCETVLNYALLPNKKYMINWPHNGNDYFVNPIPLSHEERLAEYQRAKNKTLGLIYFLQTKAGYKNLGLADDEFPTEDQLPFIPYHREARRIKGMETLTVKDIKNPYENPSRPLYQSAIAVGDYPLDHHHKENPDAPEEAYPPIPSFSIPFGSLIPQDIEGLIVAEKSISVTHLVNGCSRLQPCVILIGQAAGAAAAMCIEQKIQPWEIQIRELQSSLLDANCWLMPFLDIEPSNPYFQSIQKMGVSGIIRGHGVPYQWANQTWIYPDSVVVAEVFEFALQNLELDIEYESENKIITRATAFEILGSLIDTPKEVEGRNWQDLEEYPKLVNIANHFAEEEWFSKWIEGNLFEPEKPLLRKELAFLIDQIFDVFEGEAV